MRLLVGCLEGGSLKEILCGVGTDTSVQNALQPLILESVNCEGTGNCVDIMHNLDDHILLGRRNGKIELVNVSEKYKLKDQVCDLLDNLRLEQFQHKSKSRVKLTDIFITLQPLRGGNFLLVTRSGLVHILKLNKETDEILKLKTWEVKAPVDFAQLCDNWSSGENYVFGYGGEENQIKLVEIDASLSNLKQIWEAKNVKNDRLDMRVPVWPTAMKFLEPDKSELDTDNISKVNFQFVALTHWSYLAHHNTLRSRRPIVYKQLFDDRLPLRHLEIDSKNTTSLGNISTDTFQNFVIIIADYKKNVYRYDISGRLLGKIGKDDISGAPSFVKTVDSAYVLEGGLDKYARIFDASTGERLVKVYVGGTVNCMLLINTDMLDPVQKQNEESKKKTIDDEEDDEKLWQQLEGKKHKKARK